MNPSNPIILLTIDVEDWFQVENFKRYIPFSSWPNCESRVEKNTHRILDLLDSVELPMKFKAEGSMLKGNNKQQTTNQEPGHRLHATFFVLGWIAQRLPHLVREIHARGHEVASHGYYHNLCNQESPSALQKDLTDSKRLLEDIIGSPTFGYRAPSFAVNADVLKIIEACGYLYDSSLNSFRMHSRYGKVNISDNAKTGIASQISDTFYELPVSNVKVGTYVLPLGGGGYFRLLPFFLFKKGLETILRNENTCVFYIHPWEVDPDQPRVQGIPMFYRLRHYAGLQKTYSRLSRVIRSFEHCSFLTCAHYIRQIVI